MKYLEDLRDKHKGEELWVIGAGPSLDKYPINFFKDKICVGVNRVFSVFVNIGDGIDKFKARAFYSVHSHRAAAAWIAENIPRFLTNCFFISRPVSHKTFRGLPYCCPEDFGEGPYWIRNSYLTSDVKASDADFERMAKCLMAKRGDCRYVCRGTSLHWAIGVAVVLGAKKIYVVGASGKPGYMLKHGSFYRKIPIYKRSYPHWNEGTRCLTKVFKPYGVEIVGHCYDGGEFQC